MFAQIINHNVKPVIHYALYC